MVKGIEHIAIYSKDTNKLKDWYIQMFDLKVVYDNGKGTYFLAFESGDMLELVTCDQVAPHQSDKLSGIRHLAFSIDEDKFEDMVDKLKASGVEVVTDATEKNGIKTFFFRDIDDNVCHLIYRPTSLV